MFSLPKMSLFEQVFQTILNASTWAERRGWRDMIMFRTALLGHSVGRFGVASCKKDIRPFPGLSSTPPRCTPIPLYSVPHPLAEGGGQVCSCPLHFLLAQQVAGLSHNFILRTNQVGKMSSDPPDGGPAPN